MEGILKVYDWIVLNKALMLSGVAHLCLFASVIVKLTPTLKDDHYLKMVIKFIGKFIALDKYGPQK